MIIEKTRNQLGEPQVKIVKQVLNQYPISFVLETNSPYSLKFEMIYKKIEQAGFTEKWRRDSWRSGRKLRKEPVFEELTNIGHKRILMTLIGIGCLGFFASIMVFVFEIMVYKIAKFRN